MKFTNPDEDFFKFIEENSSEDISRLRLKHYGKPYKFDIDFALTQIECRKRCGVKLHKFTSNIKTLFPSVIASEQASHEAIAGYHASIAKSFHNILDMTAGLGIDSLAFSSIADNVTSCELDEGKASVLSYNKNILGMGNLTVVNCDSMEYLENYPDKYDLIFIDPARRGKGNSRVYNFKDCQPDILQNIDLLLSKTHTLLIKASPLLDITQTLKDIPYVNSIRAISVQGECKEILVEAEANMINKTRNGILAEAIDLNNDGTEICKFSYLIEDSNRNLESNNINYATSEDLITDNFLYEPNSTMMKLAPWNNLNERYPYIKKLGISSHLFVSDQYIPDFPGRKLRITAIPDKKILKALKGEKLNVVSRNYPMTAVELRKKLGLKEGNDEFLYATRLNTTPVIILAKKHSHT